PLERQWLERLAEARSNLPDLDGRGVYDRHVRPARVDWWRLGAHYAVTSLFESYPERVRIYCFTAEREDYRVTEAGRARLAVGRVRLTSEVSLESAALSFGVLHFGDHNVTGGAHPFTDPERYEAFGREVVEPFRRADFAEVVRLMDYHFGDSRYSIRSLFRDEQRKILDTILATALEEAEALYRQIYEPRAATMRFLAGLGIPPPKMFYAAAELVLNGRLRRALERDPIDTERVAALLENARVENVSLDTATLEFACRRTLERLADRFAADPSAAALDELDRSTALLDLLPFRVDLWKIQNAYYRVLETVYPERRRAADAGDPAARAWAERFVALGGKLAVNVS
ncbi:MAG TPA: DUF3536 domain-containing protein, partial [candidate division Zixibacteria bacterium]|nr:DUF3536 domain-containing protein [candidate division Zixibacteria bacterium]